jgi:anti-sigma factor RsiW
MNRCDQARRLFGAYWDDEVTQAEREWLESHLGGCPACRQQYEQFARTLETVGSMPRTDTATDLPERALVAARRAAAIPDRIAVAPARPMWIPVTATAALLLLVSSTLLPWLGTPAVQQMFAHRETRVTEPRIVYATAQSPGEAKSEAALVDSVLNHSEDVEFILDPVVLHRGRAQVPSRLPKGVQGEQAVISF